MLSAYSATLSLRRLHQFITAYHLLVDYHACLVVVSVHAFALTLLIQLSNHIRAISMYEAHRANPSLVYSNTLRKLAVVEDYAGYTRRLVHSILLFFAYSYFYFKYHKRPGYGNTKYLELSHRVKLYTMIIHLATRMLFRLKMKLQYFQAR